MNHGITEVSKEKRSALKPLFANMRYELIQSCLQGNTGFAWADNKSTPSCAQVIVGDFAFFAGDSENPSAARLVSNIPSWYRSGSILIVPETERWGKLIEKKHAGRVKKITRYAVDHGEFDIGLLNGYMDSLPSGYEIRRIDAALYTDAMKNEWSRDLCSQFGNAEDYLERGLGFCVMHGNEMVCGASSYAIYDDGIEIEIDTRADHRRKGLATGCAAALIVECLKRNLNPRWDAANMESVKLSEKLGYHLEAPYNTWAVTCR